MTGRLRFGCCFLALLTSLEAQTSTFARAPADKNPFDTPTHVEAGGRLFQTHCSYCHGVNGEGDRGADLTRGQYLQGGSDRELFETIRNGIEGSEMGSVRATDDEVWVLVAFVKRLGMTGPHEKAPGDVAAGKVVYERKGACAACHVIDNQGRNLGPELTAIGRIRGLKSLEESLLKPEADLPMLYRAVQVRTKSGETIVGIRLNEDDFSIQVRDTADKLRSFLKENTLEIRRDNPSLMPAYGSILTRKELTDLLAYLSSLRGTP